MSENLSFRVIKSFQEVEELRGIWSAWPGHRDSDIDVYLTTLRSSPEGAYPYVILSSCDGRPDALLVAKVALTNLNFRVGYIRFGTRRIRLLSVENGGFLGNRSPENSALVLRAIKIALQQGEADVAVLNCVPVDSPLHNSARRVPGLLTRDHLISRQPHWCMQLPDNIEKLYPSLSKSLRWEVRNKAKKFAADYSGAVSARCFRQEGELDKLFHDVEEVAKKTYQRGLGVGFTDSEPVRRLLQLEAGKGFLRGYILYASGRPCAFWIGALYHDMFYSDFLAFDPEYGKHSPGTVLLVKAMEDLCNERAAGIDFGPGEARYKQRFGNVEWKEATVYVFAPTFRGLELKFMKISTTILRQSAKMILENTGLMSTIKRVWRKHVTKKERSDFVL